MIKRFELNADQIKVRNILTGKNFIEVEIYSISNANPNRNESHFTDASLSKGVKTYVNKPIMGFFNNGDFEQHNGKISYDSELDCEFWDNSQGEQILGFIRESDRIEIKEYQGLLWIVNTAMIYTQYNFRQVKKLLKDKFKKVSVEVSVLDSEIVNGIEQIYDFELIGITILGTKNGIPVEEGIAGANLSILDFQNKSNYNHRKQAIYFAYDTLQKTLGDKENMGKEDIGTKGALKVNTSKKALSDTSWGEVDKTALRNRVVAASNFKTIASDVFLDLRPGWEEGEVSKLKYPVMQLKGDELVYNRGALSSAKGYAEKNNETEVLKKLKSIYKHLDLEFDKDKSEYAVEDFEYYENKEESMTAEEMETLQKNCDELQMRCKELEEQCGTYEARCKELEEQCGTYEARCAEQQAIITEQTNNLADYAELKTKYSESQTLVEKMQMEKTKAFLETLSTKMGLTEEEKQKLQAKCDSKDYKTEEDIESAVAYVVYKRECARIEATQGKTEQESYSYSLPITIIDSSTSNKKTSIMERLQENLK